MNYHVYILYSAPLDRFYVGQTKDLPTRLAQHNASKSTYTATGIPWSLLWSTEKPNLKSAEDLESKLKNLTRIRKIKFMRKYNVGIHDLDLLDRIIP